MTDQWLGLGRLVHYQPPGLRECLGAIVLDPVVAAGPATIAVVDTTTGQAVVGRIESVPYDEDRAPHTWHKHHEKEEPSE